ncbi:hypothetical protein [Methylacidiphilum caldifontis]|uniref:Uncharacterized protein n=1 Tax=Methylacidiphilum caldifontis TaxID=2795386 RepID=A0A4Y8PHS4_9BACT|nr:hypothetical protein [Methylacidiphilum caldifontis]TFE71329.1 hypothetical protein A7Q10_04990 [Methylacidiphilum caldifontis]
MKGVKSSLFVYFLLIPISSQALLVETSKGHRVTILNPHAVKNVEKNNPSHLPKGKVYVQPLMRASNHSEKKNDQIKTAVNQKKSKGNSLKNGQKKISSKENKLKN